MLVAGCGLGFLGVLICIWRMTTGNIAVRISPDGLYFGYRWGRYLSWRDIDHAYKGPASEANVYLKQKDAPTSRYWIDVSLVGSSVKEVVFAINGAISRYGTPIMDDYWMREFDENPELPESVRKIQEETDIEIKRIRRRGRLEAYATMFIFIGVMTAAYLLGWVE